MCTWKWRQWPPEARKDWYVELKHCCFYLTHVLWYIVLLIILKKYTYSDYALTLSVFSLNNYKSLRQCHLTFTEVFLNVLLKAIFSGTDFKVIGEFIPSTSRAYFRCLLCAVPACNAFFEFLSIFSYFKNVKFAWSLGEFHLQIALNLLKYTFFLFKPYTCPAFLK